MKLFIALILGSFLFFGPKVKVLEVTSQDWIGGRQETGYGTDYVIKVKAGRSSEKLVIDEFWADGHLLDIQEIRDETHKRLASFKKGDVLILRAGIKKIDSVEDGVKMTGALKKGAPREFDGAALIGFTLRGKRKYVEVKEIVELEEIIYL